MVLLALVQVSYRQTIAAYPDGGGSDTVASRNLGCWPGLVAGAALWLDYVLNVAVAISAGTGALVSAVPSLLPHTLSICLGILLLLTIVNLRAGRDSGVAFMLPTYLFVVSLGTVLALGVIRVVTAPAIIRRPWCARPRCTPQSRRGPRRRLSLAVNAIGAVATSATLIVILISKLAEGAWITLLLLGTLLAIFRRVAAHLGAVDEDVRVTDELDLSPMPRPIVRVPMKRLDLVARKALRFALTITDDVMAVQLLAENQGEEDLSGAWEARIQEPCRQAGLPLPKLVVHSNTSTLLKALLVQRGGPQVLVVSAPWYADRAARDRARVAGAPVEDGRASGLARPDRVATIEERGGDTHA